MPVQAFPPMYDKLIKEYGLTKKEHFWLHEKSGRWIINHYALRLIMREEGIRTFTMKLSETRSGDYVHILTGAVGFTPGENHYEAIATKDSIVILNLDNGEEFVGEAVARIKFKGGEAVAELGEGDNSNFREGYKTIIVLKRAEDRAVMELVQNKFQYSLVDQQDADIIQGQSEVFGQSPKPHEEPLVEGALSDIEAEFNKLYKEAKKWLTASGVDATKKMLTASPSFSKFTADQLKRLESLVKNAESIQNDIRSEKEEPKAFRQPTDEEKEGATPAQLEWLSQKVAEMGEITSQMKISTFLAECSDYAKTLPDGLKSYFRIAASTKKAELNRS